MNKKLQEIQRHDEMGHWTNDIPGNSDENRFTNQAEAKKILALYRKEYPDAEFRIAEVKAE
jgi:hypothetical protein